MGRHFAWILLALALCVSCQGEKFAEGRLKFRQLLKLRDQMAKEFGEKVADVRVNHDRMIVKFINSPLSSRAPEEKQQRADAVAAFVAKNYEEPVSSVSIHFISDAGATAAGGIYIGRSTPKQ